jgi:hypothetical protein
MRPCAPRAFPSRQVTDRASSILPGIGWLQSGRAARIHGLFRRPPQPMIELNPVRQRIADLTGRLHALRGFL